MVPLIQCFKPAELLPPATEEAIAQAEGALGCPLPTQLKALYRQTNGVQGDGNLTLFQAELIAERNETYGVAECLPNLLYVGNDNGDQGLFIPRSDTDSTVFESGLGDQSIEGLVTLAPSLSAWFERGCPWQDDLRS